MQTISSRIDVLRQKMDAKGIMATIIPSTDPHASEYVADYWKERQWISGFTGSAGTVVVTNNKAGLWTDSRYFLQAGLQLEGSGIDLFKDGLPDTPSITAWLGEVLPAGSRVGINPLVFSVSAVENLQNELTETGLVLSTDVDFIKTMWADPTRFARCSCGYLSVGVCRKERKRQNCRYSNNIRKKRCRFVPVYRTG